MYLFLLLTLVWGLQHPGSPPVADRCNLVPFRSIIRDVPQGGRGFWVNIVGNVVVFTPIGVAVYGRRGPRSSAWRAAAAAGALSVLIEAGQLQSGRRYCDVDDVVLNTLGGAAGYLAAAAIARLCRRRRAPSPNLESP